MAKVVYISGPITGVPQYWLAFEAAEDALLAEGFIPLSPAHLPKGLTPEQYMRIDLAMIDSADAIYVLYDSVKSKGAMLEYRYCQYIGKPVAANIKDLKEALHEDDTFGTE